MIRAYTSRDTDDLLDVWYRASLVAHPFLSESFLEEERSEIGQKWLPIAETSVYEVDGRLVGFISLALEGPVDRALASVGRGNRKAA